MTPRIENRESSWLWILDSGFQELSDFWISQNRAFKICHKLKQTGQYMLLKNRSIYADEKPSLKFEWDDDSGRKLVVNYWQELQNGKMGPALLKLLRITWIWVSSMVTHNFLSQGYHQYLVFVLNFIAIRCLWCHWNYFFWQMLNKFLCIALAGVATEYLLYGVAEGGLADINKVCTVSMNYLYWIW
jgi:hypothetical protein